MFDVAIVGFGPAGITAGIYIARRRLQAVLIGDLPGGEVVNSGEIANWPGGSATNGVTLANQLVSHLKLHQDQIKIIPDKVSVITKQAEVFTLNLKRGADIQASSVIYAAGRRPRQLGVPGEVELKNKGVSYCATCDGPLFSDKDVVVIGGGNTGAEAVIMLQKIARQVHWLHIGDQLTADPVLVEAIQKADNVKITLAVQTTAIVGNGAVKALTYQHVKTKQTKTIDIEGVFVAIGAIPNTEPIKDLIKLNQYGAVKTDRYGHTDLNGFFAAGDVTDTRDAQIVVAAGHGCSAALSAGDFITRK